MDAGRSCPCSSRRYEVDLVLGRALVHPSRTALHAHLYRLDPCRSVRSSRVSAHFSPEFILTHAATREAYLTALREFTPEIVLSDHGLPSFDSLSTPSFVSSCLTSSTSEGSSSR